MNKEKAGDLIALVVIVLLGLFTAYVTFGILQSQASAAVRQYSLGGAIAGALVASSMFFSAYRQFRKSSEEVEKLRNRIQELQQKVLRGAPCPRGFESEVDERQRIVLAKPARWLPRGGTIFDFELPKEMLQPNDPFPARLEVFYVSLTLEGQTVDEFYEKTRRTFVDSPLVGSWSSEFVYLGGEPNSIKSLKIIFQWYGQIVASENPMTGKEEIQTAMLTAQQFEEALKAADSQSQGIPSPGPTKKPPASVQGTSAEDHLESAPVSATSPTAVATSPEDHSESAPAPATSPAAVAQSNVTYRKIWQMQVVCVHEPLKKVFVLNFYDDEKDFTESSASFNQVVNSIRFLN